MNAMYWRALGCGPGDDGHNAHRRTAATSNAPTAPPSHQRRGTDKPASLPTPTPRVRRKWSPRLPDNGRAHKAGSGRTRIVGGAPYRVRYV